MPVTAFYAALLAPLCVFLSARVVFARRAARVALGDGGDEDLRRRIRAHANFTEYAPFALLLLGLAESLKTGRWALHAIGAALLIGRCVHAFGVSRIKEDFRIRVTGMALTFIPILGAAAACLIGAMRQ